MSGKCLHKQKEESLDKEKEEKNSELEENWKRALADYRNLQKRVQEQREEWTRLAAKETLAKLLPVFDTFEQVEKHVNDDGLKLAVKQLFSVLAELGVERLETLGRPFDPQLMEAVEVVEEDDGKVVEEIRPGYKLKDILLRAAQVKVGKKEINEKAEEVAKKEEQRGDYM